MQLLNWRPQRRHLIGGLEHFATYTERSSPYAARGANVCCLMRWESWPMRTYLWIFSETETLVLTGRKSSLPRKCYRPIIPSNYEIQSKSEGAPHALTTIGEKMNSSMLLAPF